MIAASRKQTMAVYIGQSPRIVDAQAPHFAGARV
ncbi:hypothetical protein F783_014270 [Bordetella holmesii F627]|nr:hypothetical protein F783_014270 [Bordetella holmesii F627]